MPEVLLIGYGNPLRSDDGIGWRVTQWFEENVKNPSLEVQTYHQLTPDLADDIHRVRRVVFIDAREGGEPGTIHCEELHPAEIPESAFTHHVTPQTLLAYSQSVYGSAPQAFLITVTGAEFGYGERLSETLESILPQVISTIQNNLTS